MGLPYRLRQYALASGTGQLPAEQLEEVASVLGEQANRLFLRFADSERAHAVRVYRLLREHAHSDLDLLAAALLHDAGKIRAPLVPWERALVVVVEKLAPRRAESWGEGPARGWRRPFVVRRHHAAWGAELAHEAGVSVDAVTLIRCHQSGQLPAGMEHLQRQLQLLQWADDRS